MQPGEFKAATGSSNILGYSWIEGVLRVQFRSGQTYEYRNVPEEVYQGLDSAESKGSYFHRHIRQRYVGEAI